MTSRLDVVKAWLEDAWTNPPSSITESNMTHLSDDFQNLDQDGNVLMNKEGYNGVAQLMAAAFSGLKAVVSDLREEGDSVIMNSHFEGTHTGDFDLSAMGVGVIPASGKMIVWPDANVKIRVEGGQIVSLQQTSGGMEWFLAPLGVKLPSE